MKERGKAGGREGEVKGTEYTAEEVGTWKLVISGTQNSCYVNDISLWATMAVCMITLYTFAGTTNYWLRSQVTRPGNEATLITSFQPPLGTEKVDNLGLQRFTHQFYILHPAFQAQQLS